MLATTQPATPVDASIPATRVVSVSTEEGCRDRQYSELSRFWELENGSDCGTFVFRGYRPINVSFSAASDKPEIPTSPAEGHTGTATAYQANEMRIGVSIRTKLAQGLLTQNDPQKRIRSGSATRSNRPGRFSTASCRAPFALPTMSLS